MNIKGRTLTQTSCVIKKLNLKHFRTCIKIRANYVATGHYARIHRHEDGRVEMLRG